MSSGPSAGTIAIIALGGAIGTLARFGLVEASRVWLSAAQGAATSSVAFPWGTLAVNLLGCFAMGLLATALTASVREDLRFGLLVGILGGFTTFSAFAWESRVLWVAGRHGASLAYVLSSVLFGLLFLSIGAKCADWLSAQR